jgi:cellobiose-specific phosphotransferase system component IIB
MPIHIPHVQLQEWQKILLTALAGFCAAIFAEPLKLRVTERYKKRKLRKMCYEHILAIRDTLNHVAIMLARPQEQFSSGLTHEEYARFMVPNLNIGPLKYAIESESAILYQLDVALTVTRIVHSLQGVKESSPIEEIKEACRAIVFSIDREVNWIA